MKRARRTMIAKQHFSICKRVRERWLKSSQILFISSRKLLDAPEVYILNTLCERVSCLFEFGLQKPGISITNDNRTPNCSEPFNDRLRLGAGCSHISKTDNNLNIPRRNRCQDCF